MIDTSTIATALIDLIGWRQWTDPTKPLHRLDDSTSGVYYQDAHPLVTLENIQSVAPRYDGYEYEAIPNTPIKTYKKGFIGTAFDGLHFLALKDTNNNVTVAQDWQQIDIFSEHLKTIVTSGISEVLRDWRAKKAQFKASKSLKSNRRLHRLESADAWTPAHRYLGYRIDTSKEMGEVINLEKIALQFEQAQSIDIHLLEVGGDTTTKTLDYTNAGKSQWFDLGEQLKYNRTYYLYYDSEAITGKPLNGIPTQAVNNRLFQGIGSDTLDTDLDTSYYDTNFGLNVQYSKGCDLTDFVIDQKDLFVDAIYYKVAIKVLERLAHNPGAFVNRNQVNIEANAVIFEIQGDPTGRKTGLLKQYDDALNAIDFDTQAISKKCLKCGNANRIKYGSVFG